jgi:manganese/zinc/iron transport system permease protein
MVVLALSAAPMLSLQTDLAPMLAGVLAAVLCGVLGGVLVVRRSAMLGDALSHAVLPGLVLGFIVTGSRATAPMLIGAALAALAAVGLIALLRRAGRLDAGAAMGVVFSVMFAMGTVLLRFAGDRVDLDADCVLYGVLEAIRWPGVVEAGDLLRPGAWAAVPRQVVVLAAMLGLSVAVLVVLRRHVLLWCFDPALARAMGQRPGLVGGIVMGLVAGATVASFEAVGSILVLALLACPGVAARQLTDRFGPHLVPSGVLAGVQPPGVL